VKRLIVTLLVFNAFTPTVFAQTVEQEDPTTFFSCVEIIRGTQSQTQCQNVLPPTISAKTPQRQRILSGWQQKVEGAERDYKNKNGRYGDLAALRKAHLLQGLAFEPCSSAGASGKEKANFVPKSTLFSVTVSEDGQLFHLTIVDGAGNCYRHRPQRPIIMPPMIMPDFDDSPEGPILPG
jgi:hypothetical protein